MVTPPRLLSYSYTQFFGETKVLFFFKTEKKKNETDTNLVLVLQLQEDFPNQLLGLDMDEEKTWPRCHFPVEVNIKNTSMRNKSFRDNTLKEEHFFYNALQ